MGWWKRPLKALPQSLWTDAVCITCTNLHGHRVTKHGSIQTCLHHLAIKFLPPNRDRYPQEPKLPSRMFCLEQMTSYLAKGRWRQACKRYCRSGFRGQILFSILVSTNAMLNGCTSCCGKSWVQGSKKSQKFRPSEHTPFLKVGLC